MRSKVILAAAVWMLVLGLLVGCVSEPPAAPQPARGAAGRGRLERVPAPALERLEPGVREQIAARRAALDRLMDAPGTPPRRLGRSFGELGKLYHAYQLLDAARACYRNAIELTGSPYVWLHYLGRVEQARGRSGAAAQWLRRAAQRRPQEAVARVWLGIALQESGRLDAARSELETALRLDPKSTLAEFRLGQIAMQQQDFAAAADHYEKALRLQPSASVIHLPLANAYRAMGDPVQAQAQLALRGTGQIELSDPLMEQLQTLVQSARSHADRGVRAYEAGRFAEAEAELRQALAAAPQDASIHLNLGSALAKLGRRAEAVSAYRTSLRLDPKNIQAHFNLATLLAAKGELSAAVELYRDGLKLDPNDAKVHFNLANALLRLGGFTAAAEHYRRTIDLDPGNARARLGEAVSLSRLGRDRQALERLEQGRRALPEERSLTNALARLFAASPDPAVRNGARAQELIQTLIGSASDLEHVETQAMVYAELGDFASAMRWQQAALDAVRASKRSDLLAPLEANLELYRAQRPCRTPWYPQAFGARWEELD